MGKSHKKSQNTKPEHKKSKPYQMLFKGGGDSDAGDSTEVDSVKENFTEVDDDSDEVGSNYKEDSTLDTKDAKGSLFDKIRKRIYLNEPASSPSEKIEKDVKNQQNVQVKNLKEETYDMLLKDKEARKSLKEKIRNEAVGVNKNLIEFKEKLSRNVDDSRKKNQTAQKDMAKTLQANLENFMEKNKSETNEILKESHDILKNISEIRKDQTAALRSDLKKSSQVLTKDTGVTRRKNQTAQNQVAKEQKQLAKEHQKSLETFAASSRAEVKQMLDDAKKLLADIHSQNQQMIEKQRNFLQTYLKNFREQEMKRSKQRNEFCLSVASFVENLLRGK